MIVVFRFEKVLVDGFRVGGRGVAGVGVFIKVFVFFIEREFRSFVVRGVGGAGGFSGIVVAGMGREGGWGLFEGL